MNSTTQPNITNKHRIDLDIIKAISIIAVVFYHIGWLDTGYLGVDVFFAINGFLIIPSLVKQISEGRFNYFVFLLKRIMRLWPLVLLASAVCLITGYVVGMLPDDYENLSQSVIASDVMSQNILSAITTKNYWDTVNEYKPLMHFWYIGILVELYVVLPLILMLTKSITQKSKVNFTRIAFIVLSVFAVGSFVLYLCPSVSVGDRFYLLPFRLWELIIGGLLGIVVGREEKRREEKRREEKRREEKRGLIGGIAIIGLILTLCSSLYLPYEVSEIQSVSGLATKEMLVPQNILLILSVILTCIVLKNPIKICKTKICDIFAMIGKMSFSIFVWHQILLAFYRYLYGDDMTVVFVASMWVVTIILSILTYYTIEQKIKPSWRNFAICCVALVVNCISAGWVYINAGIVRDVPELDVYVGDTHIGQFAEYCDRVYSYNEDFPDNNKLNVLVAGVSFGRDFANILLESNQICNMNLSYIFEHDEKYAKRYAECDYLFTFNKKSELPSYIWDNLNPEAKVYGLGTKNYGSCNGVIYKHRKEDDYFDRTVKINPNFYIINEEWKQSWGEDSYIDFLELSSSDNGEIRVFTDDKKYISQDCQHLTQNGAKWYAKIIDWSSIF